MHPDRSSTGSHKYFDKNNSRGGASPVSAVSLVSVLLTSNLLSQVDLNSQLNQL